MPWGSPDKVGNPGQTPAQKRLCQLVAVLLPAPPPPPPQPAAGGAGPAPSASQPGGVADVPQDDGRGPGALKTTPLGWRAVGPASPAVEEAVEGARVGDARWGAALGP